MGCQNSKVGIQFLGSLQNQQQQQLEGNQISPIRQIQVLENSDNLLALSERNEIIQYEMKSQQIMRVYNLDSLREQQNQIIKPSQSVKFTKIQEQANNSYNYNPLQEDDIQQQQQNAQFMISGQNSKIFGNLQNQNNKKYVFQVSKDNKYIAVANGEDKQGYGINLYQFGYKFQELKSFTGHKKKVIQLEFSKDTTILATASDDQTVRIWAVRLLKKDSQKNNDYVSPNSSIKTPLRQINKNYNKQATNSVHSYEFNMANQKTSALISPQSRNRMNQVVPISEGGMGDSDQDYKYQLSNNYSKVSKYNNGNNINTGQLENQNYNDIQNQNQNISQNQQNQNATSSQQKQQNNNSQLKNDLQQYCQQQGIGEDLQNAKGYLKEKNNENRSDEDMDQVDISYLQYQQLKKQEQNKQQQKSSQQNQESKQKKNSIKLNQRLKSHEQMGTVNGLNQDLDKKLSMSASPHKNRTYQKQLGKKFNLIDNMNNTNEQFENENENESEVSNIQQQKQFQSSKLIKKDNISELNKQNSNLNSSSYQSGFLQKEEVMVIQLGKKVKQMKLGNSGEICVISCSDQTIRLWDIIQKQQIWSIKVPQNCNSIDISQNDSKIVVACGKFILLIDTQSGKIIYEKQRSVGTINSVKFSYKNEYIILAGKDQKILVLDSSDGEIMFKVYAHSKQVNQIEIINKKQIATCSNDGLVKIWEIPTRITSINQHMNMRMNSGIGRSLNKNGRVIVK